MPNLMNEELASPHQKKVLTIIPHPHTLRYNLQQLILADHPNLWVLERMHQIELRIISVSDTTRKQPFVVNTHTCL